MTRQAMLEYLRTVRPETLEGYWQMQSDEMLADLVKLCQRAERQQIEAELAEG